MNDIDNILQQVLSTDLLAPSLCRLAEMLGYKGRTSLYRMREGAASDKAIGEFCKRLNDILFISEDSLREMIVTISNTYLLLDLMKREVDTSQTGWQQQVILAFISKKFSIFPTKFRKKELGPLMKLEMEDADSFYNMLAYFFVKSTNYDFYTKGLTHSQQCAALIEPIGEWLAGIYPENSIARRVSLLYSESEVYNAEANTLWNAVKSLALVLECFATPDIYRQTINKLYNIPEIGERSYWKGNTDRNTVILMWLNKGDLPGSGFYEVYHIDRRDYTCKNVCKLSFMSEEIVSLVDVVDKNSKLGGFTFDGETLSFNWERDKDDATHSGNHWKLLPLLNSASLRDLDRSISDETLTRSALFAEGWEQIESMEVEDLAISKQQVKLYLKNKSAYAIGRDKAPFLKQVSPDMPVGIFRRVEDGKMFVIWLTLKQTLPLSLFMKEDAYVSIFDIGPELCKCFCEASRIGINCNMKNR